MNRTLNQTRLGCFLALAGCGASAFVGCDSSAIDTTDTSPASSVREPLDTSEAARVTRRAQYRTAIGCDDCELDYEVEVTLPLTQRHLRRAKLHSPTRGFVESAVDAANGQFVPIQALIAAEGAAHIARQGKLQDDLHAIAAQRPQDQIVPVWIWANFQDHPTPKDQLALMSEAAQAADAAARLQSLRNVTSRIVTWLETRGISPIQRGERSPAITADVPVSMLRPLGALSDAAIVGYRHPGRPTTTSWFESAQFDQAQAVQPTTSIPFCNSEGAVDTTNLSISGQNIAGTAFDHTTYTTELIASTVGPRAAPGAPTYINLWDSTTLAEEAWDWCFQQSIRYMNFSHSFSDGSTGLATATDMEFDFYAKVFPYPLIVASAGNKGHTSTSYVENRAHNGLVVGSIDDHGTALTGDDTMADFSSWTNPTTTNGDFELPMVVAPGVSVDSTSFPGKSGTSASAPLVLGATLLAAERATTGAYINWPEMMRASVYAAATNPVDGAITPWIGGGSGDLRRGAGALDASALVALAGVPNIAPNGVPVTSGHYARTYTFASDFGATGRSYDQYFMKPLSSAITGARLRVAIAFDATANGCAATDSSGC